ncbi:MAG: hypothetical protein U5Q44_10315 [Dehalococcoidia bacterium]|nr:hypothetical protein [Dehalococcoidia bacterium]
MTARQPRRTRRRNVPGDSLPGIRSTGRSRERAEGGAAAHERTLAEHHVTNDYRYVRKELAMIAGVTAVTVAFILGMSFIV